MQNNEKVSVHLLNYRTLFLRNCFFTGSWELSSCDQVLANRTRVWLHMIYEGSWESGITIEGPQLIHKDGHCIDTMTVGKTRGGLQQIAGSCDQQQTHCIGSHEQIFVVNHSSFVNILLPATDCQSGKCYSTICFSGSPRDEGSGKPNCSCILQYHCVLLKFP